MSCNFVMLLDGYGHCGIPLNLFFITYKLGMPFQLRMIVWIWTLPLYIILFQDGNAHLTAFLSNNIDCFIFVYISILKSLRSVSRSQDLTMVYQQLRFVIFMFWTWDLRVIHLISHGCVIIIYLHLKHSTTVSVQGWSRAHRTYFFVLHVMYYVSTSKGKTLA